MGGVEERDEEKICTFVLQNIDCINCENLIKIRGIRRASIESWVELKRETRKRFVPLCYKRDLFVKLQKMYQGSRTVQEYFKDMEVTLIRAQIVES
ncbi:hypothetical protein CR513_27791, partial [Mucuna pruriens]